MFTKKQQGFGIIQMVLVMAVASMGAYIAISTGVRLMSSVKSNGAVTEVMLLASAGQQYRQVNGSYTGISVTALATNGYNVGSLATGTGDNVYGMNSAMASASSNTDVRLSYAADDRPSCNVIRQRVTSFDGYKSGAACTAVGVLSAVFE